MPRPARCASPRIDVALVVGGRWHDLDFARLELLDLLDEHDAVRCTVHTDFSEIDVLAAADAVVAYTCDVRPTAEEAVSLASAVRAGTRLLALHATNSAIDPPVDGGPRLFRTPDAMPEFTALLGNRFLAHPKIGPARIDVVRPKHPLVAGVPSFVTTDEVYVMALRDDLDVLLDTEFAGECPGFEVSHSGPRTRHPVLYTRDEGDRAGRVLHARPLPGAVRRLRPRCRRPRRGGPRGMGVAGVPRGPAAVHRRGQCTVTSGRNARWRRAHEQQGNRGRHGSGPGHRPIDRRAASWPTGTTCSPSTSTPGPSPTSAAALGCRTAVVDVTDDAAVAAVAGQAPDCRVLVNNAAIQRYQDLLHTTHDEMRTVLDVNVIGPVLMAQALVPVMAANGGGVVINLSSITSRAHAAATSLYPASKAAVNQLTQAMAVEFAPMGVRCNAVGPGTVITEGTAGHYGDEGARAAIAGVLPDQPDGSAGGHRERRELPVLRRGVVDHRARPSSSTAGTPPRTAQFFRWARKAPK